jgi:nicotinamidase-related amidase
MFKDADGLDRVRLPFFLFDPAYLRRPYSPELVPFARELLRASEGPGASEADGPAVPRPYLVVVDVQNDFVSEALGTAEAQAALPAMVRKVRDFRGQVVFTKDTHDDRYAETQEGEKLPVPHCLVGTPGWQLAEPLDAIQRERKLPVYLKGTFGSVDLMRDLEAAYARGAVESVEFIGLCTDICVVSNAMLVKAAMPQLPVIVDGSCCAGVTPQAHEAALAVMRSCQIVVR